MYPEIKFLLIWLTSERCLFTSQLGNYLYNFPNDEINFADLFNKIAEACEVFMIFRNLLKKFSWFQKSFDRLTYFIE